MCRSIKRLRERDEIAAEDEIEAAARQFIRKVSGFQKPSQKHAAASEGAVDEVTATTRRLLEAISAAGVR
jgi:hypothetical protein